MSINETSPVHEAEKLVKSVYPEANAVKMKYYNGWGIAEKQEWPCSYIGAPSVFLSTAWLNAANQVNKDLLRKLEL